MSKIKNLSFILLIIFLFFINTVSANINITFQSDNEKVINFTNIDDGYSLFSSNTTNQTTNLTYNNYIVKLYSSNTKIDDNGTFFIKNLKAFNNDDMLFIWLIVIIILIFAFFKIVDSKT